MAKDSINIFERLFKQEKIKAKFTKTDRDLISLVDTVFIIVGIRADGTTAIICSGKEKGIVHQMIKFKALNYLISNCDNLYILSSKTKDVSKVSIKMVRKLLSSTLTKGFVIIFK